jgi:ABC-type Zn uptake system ZnuABC Zn-binding protein ZnuA
MMARNIKEGFKEYITNSYMKKEIDENYEKLKIDISEIDAETSLIVDNATNKTIVVADDLFLFLQKYGLEVLSLEDNNNLTAKKLDDIEKLMKNKKINYIFIKNNDELNEKAKALVEKYNIPTLSFKTGSNLSEIERSEKIDLIKIFYNNIEELKKELY